MNDNLINLDRLPSLSAEELEALLKNSSVVSEKVSQEAQEIADGSRNGFSVQDNKA